MSDSTNSSFRFRYRFHAAGQGLFSSGSLIGPGTINPFHWVFDCGSTSSKKVLRPKIESYRDLVIGNSLDLLCISHFDNDHVSGLSDLLSGLHVRTVVMPYLSATERLILGSRCRKPSSQYIRFLSNPVLFLLNEAASVDQIVLVGRDQSGDAGENTNVPLDPSPERRESWDLKLAVSSYGDPRKLVTARTYSLAREKGTTLIAANDSFDAVAVHHACYPAAWEFKFFHKPIDSIHEDNFRMIVANCLPSGEIPANGTELASALRYKPTRKRIKNCYENLVCRLPREDINSTSLCVYSGPNLENFQTSRTSQPWPNPVLGGHDLPFYGMPSSPEICSILYTGDADFSVRPNRDELREFLGHERWRNIFILQVPHHGSKFNWEIGSSNEFGHSYSLFCADEHNRQYKHPSREVILDLLNRNPLVANKDTGWSWRGVALFAANP